MRPLLAALGLSAGTAVFRGVSVNDSDFTRRCRGSWSTCPGSAGAAAPLAYLTGAVLLIAVEGYAVDAAYQWLYRLLHLPALEEKVMFFCNPHPAAPLGSKE